MRAFFAPALGNRPEIVTALVADCYKAYEAVSVGYPFGNLNHRHNVRCLCQFSLMPSSLGPGEGQAEGADFLKKFGEAPHLRRDS
jgi:hypothetical protein